MIFCISLQGASSFVLNTFTNDIGQKIGVRMKDAEITELLNNPWAPPPKFQFPKLPFGNQMRSFQRGWLSTYPWLVYSPSQSGGYCKFCALFGPKEASRSNQVSIPKTT